MEIEPCYDKVGVVGVSNSEVDLETLLEYCTI